jgi:hypothetical protein
MATALSMHVSWSLGTLAALAREATGEGATNKASKLTERKGTLYLMMIDSSSYQNYQW